MDDALYLRTRKAWSAARGRCFNPNDRAYRHYGGRGISVAPEWNAFEAFLRDMGLVPGPGYSLDRHPDNNGDYAPGNCRWATKIDQVRNRRNTVFYTYRGERTSLAELADRAGLPYKTVFARLHKLGWSIELALETPAISRIAERSCLHCRATFKPTGSAGKCCSRACAAHIRWGRRRSQHSRLASLYFDEGKAA